MKSISTMIQVELAAFIQAKLLKQSIQVVLSGGGAVVLYSENQYVSLDIDLVNMHFTPPKKIQSAMEELGFHEKGRHYFHPESKYSVEFPAGPLSVGREGVKEIKSISLSTGTLKVISPTDCVKDRLLAYIHWTDQQSLVQAKLVAKKNLIDWDEIRRWGSGEFSEKQIQQVLEIIRA